MWLISPLLVRVWTISSTASRQDMQRIHWALIKTQSKVNNTTLSASEGGFSSCPQTCKARFEFNTLCNSLLSHMGKTPSMELQILEAMYFDALSRYTRLQCVALSCNLFLRALESKTQQPTFPGGKYHGDVGGGGVKDKRKTSRFYFVRRGLFNKELE